MRSIRLAPAMIVASLLLLGGCAPETADTGVDFRASVRVEPVRRGDVESVLVTTGTVRASREAKVVVETAGKLQIATNPRTGERFRVGDPVREGQVLAVVAADELRTSSRVDARLKAAQAAEAEHRKNVALYEEGLISELQLDEYETKLANARADYENALLQESKGRIEAPFTGVLTEVTTSAEGAYAGIGEVVARVMDFDEVIVDLDLGTSEVLSVREGQPVRVRGYSDAEAFEGVVERVAPAIDPASRTFRVEVTVPNPERRLRPGMFVRAEIVVDARRDAVVVPVDAVLDRDGRWVVFVVEAQRAVQREIDVGLVSEERAEVEDGLAVGERVVVGGQDTLRDGARVIVQS